MPVSDQAFVTLATNDMYCQGALVLGQSLRNQRATRKLVVLVTPQVSSLLRVILSRVFDEVLEVNLMDSADYIHLAFLRRPELGVTLTKLHCWTLTHYSKCVFLDADTLVLSNIDDLFDRGEFSAAPDPGWPDCFNSGVFVFQPSLETHSLLLQHATDHGSFDGADQGLLNSFFSSWSTADIHKHLPFIYNLSSNTAYTYSPAFKQFGASAKVVHFLGSTKPWNYTYDPQTGLVSETGSGSVPRQQASFLNLWWAIYHQSILPLYGSVRDEEEGTSPGHTACLSGIGVPCANPAPRAEGRCANSVPGAGEPCAHSATGSSQAWNAEDRSAPTVVEDEMPPSPEGSHSEDMLGWPDMETSAGVVYDPLLSVSPQCADFTETQAASVQRFKLPHKHACLSQGSRPCQRVCGHGPPRLMSHGLSEWLPQPGICGIGLSAFIIWVEQGPGCPFRFPPLLPVGPSVFIFYLALGRTREEKDTTSIGHACLPSLKQKSSQPQSHVSYQ